MDRSPSPRSEAGRIQGHRSRPWPRRPRPGSGASPDRGRAWFTSPRDGAGSPLPWAILFLTARTLDLAETCAGITSGRGAEAWPVVVGFVHPTSGRTVFHLATSVSIPLFEAELAAFARAVGAGPKKQVVLILDRAGWHTSVRLRVPEHVHLLSLPAYSPELQPAEHLLDSAGR